MDLAFHNKTNIFAGHSDDGRKQLIVNAVVAAVFIIFTFMKLAVKNGFMLRWYDEMSLFEPTRFFFRQCMYFPGGILRYAGTWLTQLMYYPWLGTAVIVALWLALAWLIGKAFRFPAASAPLALIVPMALFVSVAHLDEAWVSMKSAGYIFFPTLGYIFTVGAVIAYRAVESKAYFRIPVLVVLAFCYAVAGFFALFSVLICVVFDIADGIRERRWTRVGESAAALVLAAVLPHLYYIYVPGNLADNDYLYLKGLPDLYLEAYDVYLWIPFIVATATLLLLCVASAARVRLGKPVWKISAVVAFAAACVWGFCAEKKSEHLRATVVMLKLIECGDWANVRNVMSVVREQPNYTMMVLNGLAATKLGEQFPDPVGYPHLNLDPRHSDKFTETAFISVPVNYHVGEFNQSYRWAMEHCVQYGRRVFFLKYMVKCALMNGEPALARRYNDILLRTMFHRRWAEDMQRYIDDPSLIETNPEFRALARRHVPEN